MKKKVEEIKHQFQQDTQEANLKTLQDLKIKYLGKKGAIQALMTELRNIEQENRAAAGKLINDLKQEISTKLEELISSYSLKEEEKRLKEETIDVSLPGKKRFSGKKHPITQMIDEMLTIFVSMGFSVQKSPEIDTDYYNFESLNFKPGHPARDLQDTFYVTEQVLLRTHVTNIQVHVMEKTKPPIRVVSPGKCYRNEEISARSHVFFHQIDGFYVDEGVSFADLLNTMQTFVKKLFGQDVKTRFRPSYFPFVEPGLEVDISCTVCGGKGCSICKGTGWLEILGAGMIHPEVLKNGGIDPEKYTGFAWGVGIERPLMLKYRIDDIRLFAENDMRFLRQF